MNFVKLTDVREGEINVNMYHVIWLRPDASQACTDVLLRGGTILTVKESVQQIIEMARGIS